MEKKKVVVGLSGGVDSSVAAYLLKKQGYEVIGVTMQIWQEEEPEFQEENGGCCGLSAVDDARRVAAKLEIPYYVMNFRKEFKENVIDYFIREYREGRTPNPCIACNRYVKWEALLKRKPGYWSRLYCHRSLCTGGETGKRPLCHPEFCNSQKGSDLCPVQPDTGTAGAYSDACRRIYKRGDPPDRPGSRDPPVAHKKDSQEICFVPDKDYAGFIEKKHRGKNPPQEIM